MAYPSVEGLSVVRGNDWLCGGDELLDASERRDRVDAIDPLFGVGTVPIRPDAEVGEIARVISALLTVLVMVSVELRFGVYDDRFECEDDSIDIVEERRERSLDMKRMDSCSEMGDGPGKGGSGATGGREGGGLANALSWRESAELSPFGVGGK